MQHRALSASGGRQSMMHDVPSPMALLNRWLRGVAHANGNYGHILFEQAIPNDGAVVDELRPYFESAHRDAREVFHRAARIDLHPDAEAPEWHAQCPICLPPTARKRLFGAIVTGLPPPRTDLMFVAGNCWGPTINSITTP